MELNDKLDILQNRIIQLGTIAAEKQKRIGYSLKKDGTLLTESDLMISKGIIETIEELFPDCGIISEETREVSFNENAKYNFVLDPIDGTDSYAQGMPFWCISLGILDNNRVPVGGIIYSPTFGSGTQSMLIRSNPCEKEIYINSKIPKIAGKESIPRQVAIGSHTLKELNLANFQGKIRSFGSSILHLISPLIFSRIDAALVPKCYVWDIASAHAIVLKAGFEIVNSDGTPFIYDDYLVKELHKFKMPVYCAKKNTIDWLLKNLITL